MMNLELLSIVEKIGVPVFDVEQFGLIIDYKWMLELVGEDGYRREEQQHERINAHELAAKYKMWGYSLDYHINAKYKNNFWEARAENLITGGYDHVSKFKYCEYDAIFEVCEMLFLSSKKWGSNDSTNI